MKIKKLIPLMIIITLIISLSTVVFGVNTGEIQPRTQNEIMPISETEANNTTEITQNPEAKTHEGDLYVFFSEDNSNTSSYVMDKNVDGNVFIFGKDVKITGEINGSLFVFATNLTIDESAYIALHTFAAAENITMAGFTSDMYAACGTFNMTDTGVVYRDLKLASENATLLGQIGRDLDMTANNVKVYENEESSLYVGGNLSYSSVKEIEHINDIKVDGEVNYTQITEPEETNSNVALDYLYGTIGSVVFTLVIYALMIFLAPKFVEKSKEYMSPRFFLSAAIGLAFTILVPIIAIILLCTVLGVPLMFLILAVYIFVLMINSVVVATAINEVIVSKVQGLNTTWKKILMIIPVSAVLYLLKQIPFVGIWISAIIFLIGVGIVVLYQFDKRKKEKVVEE